MGFDERYNNNLTRIAKALERIANTFDQVTRSAQISKLGSDAGIAAKDITTFTDTVTRYVTSDPLPEGDWQLHDDGHEGEDKE